MHASILLADWRVRGYELEKTAARQIVAGPCIKVNLPEIFLFSTKIPVRSIGFNYENLLGDFRAVKVL